MRVLLTGCGGNIGTGLLPRLLAEGHEVICSDLSRPPSLPQNVKFYQIDIQEGFGLEKAAEGVDLILHTPAHHGIHHHIKTDIDFWRLNVQGTFWMFQAAIANNVRKVVFLSSQAWHGHYNKYGFTKVIAEELCEFNRVNHDVSYISIRPHDFTPWGSEWTQRYGARLLYGGVDREDVLDCVMHAVTYLGKEGGGEGDKAIRAVLDATRPDVYTAQDIEGWEKDPKGTCEKVFPGSGKIIEKYGINVSKKPEMVPHTGWEQLGYKATRHFGTFIKEISGMTEDQVKANFCPYQPK